MLKRSLFFGSVALMAVMLIVAGCEGPVGPEGPAGSDGAPGAEGTPGAAGEPGANGGGGAGADGNDGQDGASGLPGLTVLTGPLSTKAIQRYIDNTAYDVEFAGVTQSDAGVVTIPADRAAKAVKFVGPAAYKLGPGISVLAIVAEEAVSIQAGATIDGNGQTIIAPAALAADIGGTAGLLASANPSYAGVGPFNVLQDNPAIPVAISGNELAGKTLTVFGNATVSAAAALGAATINVTDDLAVNATLAATGGINVLGDLTTNATGAITGSVNVGGDVTFGAAQTALTGLTAGGDVTAGTGPYYDVTSSGTIDVGGDLTAKDITITSGYIDVDGLISAANINTSAANGNLVATSLVLTGNLNTGTGTVYVAGDAEVGGAITSGAVTTTNGGDLTAESLTATGVVTVAGKLEADEVTVTGAYALTAGSLDVDELTLGENLTVTSRADIDTLVTASGSVLTFNGVTTISEDINDAVQLPFVIDGTGEVTLTAELPDTSGGTNKITIKNTGGVTLSAVNTIAENFKATGVIIVGEATTGVIIASDTDLTVPGNGAYIEVPTTGSLVAGGGTGAVTIAGATLKQGTYEAANAAAATLKLAAATEIEVGTGGSITIGAVGNAAQIVLGDATTSVIKLVDGGELFAADGDSDIETSSGTDHSKVLLSVYETADPLTTAAYLTYEENDDVWTVTYSSSAAASNSAEAVVGKIKWGIDLNIDTATAIGGEDSSPSSAPGTLKAGSATTLVITGDT
ncbi:MAG: hypothetical protein LBQ35_06585 [Spirochaetaceae bacterium]|jgi:hypothetical protein|nr:hypothetical protein [Spirochaetaceae bacterium]